MAAFIAHPSVRIKGTEHNYNPVLCQDETCSAKAKESHMHCPFCSITEAYQDPVILRAHYRVKHVDKGIDFAGLKVLRCCNHCEIVGTIKGEKKFKGAHWHCYRCRNGFNRRDEAIKHYKTHFRNPHTTFQIQITQEVNSRQYYEQSAEAHPKAYSGLAIGAGSNGDYSAIGPMLTQTIIATSTSADTLLADGPKDSSVNNGIAVGAEETVGLSQQAMGQQTLVVMDPDGETGNLIYDTSGIITEQGGDGLEQSLLLEKQILELHHQNQVLRTEKDAMEKKLQAEIQHLKDHMASLVQANVKMFEELQLYRSSESSEQKIKKLVESLEAQHRELLQTQLGTLRKELLNRAGALPVNGHTEVLQLSLPQGGEEGEGAGAMSISFLSEDQSSGPEGGAATLTGLEIVEVQLEASQVEPEPKMESPVPAATPFYSVEVLEGEQDVLSPEKRSPEAEPEGEGKTKRQRTT
ncbi:hypothetical protein AAFF_G00337430 [Aldrovandia affinis]|uniref:C2H2-type domain-containing protein n=1 Tax=Aldrovandia affinis TaxID=143900 RepID=A0AAD7SKW3_9TELE|nr:hypothetical protein AAFF_G00337430 [Aldrovandia affinis]